MGRRRTLDLDLPTRVYKDRNSFRYRPPGSRISIRLCSAREDVETALRRVAGSTTRMDVRHLGRIRGQAKQNALARGLEFSLTAADVGMLWTRSAGRCELSGLKFDLLNPSGYRRRPMAPSIDRADSSSGYSLQNCRLVVAILNLAINEFGEETFAKAARAYIKFREKRRIDIPQLE